MDMTTCSDRSWKVADMRGTRPSEEAEQEEHRQHSNKGVARERQTKDRKSLLWKNAQNQPSSRVPGWETMMTMIWAHVHMRHCLDFHRTPPTCTSCCSVAVCAM